MTSDPKPFPEPEELILDVTTITSSRDSSSKLQDQGRGCPREKSLFGLVLLVIFRHIVFRIQLLVEIPERPLFWRR